LTEFAQHWKKSLGLGSKRVLLARYGMATFYADSEATAANAPPRKGKAVAWGERAPEAKAAVEARAARRRKRARPDFDAAVMRKLQMRLKQAIGPEPAVECLSKFDKSGDGLLDVEELTHMIRADLKISSDDLKDSDITAFLNVVDEDKSGALSVEELAEFAEHGISHFYNAETLAGKDLKLPRPKGCDPDTLGRVIGAMQARLRGKPIRPRFQPVDGDGDGRARGRVTRTSVMASGRCCLGARRGSCLDATRLGNDAHAPPAAYPGP